MAGVKAGAGSIPAPSAKSNVMNTPTHNDIFTETTLRHIAQSTKDKTLVDLCNRAVTCDNTRRELAVYMDRLWGTMSVEDREGLSPGIRLLVEGLNAVGYHTCDSGDGSNWEAGMGCALPYRHVMVIPAPWQDTAEEVLRIRRYLVWLGLEHEFDVAQSDPEPGISDVIFVQDSNAKEIMDRVGYVEPTLEDLVGECEED